jgi:hypothetical protein
MKLLIILSLTGFFLVSCSNSKEKNKEKETGKNAEALHFENPEDYNNAILEQQSLIFESVDNLDKAINNYEPAEMDDAIANAKKTIDNSLIQINRIGFFKGDSLYSEAAKVFFETYKEIIYNEYSQLVKLYKLSEEEFGEEGIRIVDSLDNSITNKQDSSFKKFWKIQAAFAKEFLLVE